MWMTSLKIFLEMSSKKYDIASVNEVLGHSYLAFLHTEEIIQEIQKKI